MGAAEHGRTEYPVIGIVAHVDAGKTTLSEGLLYEAGAIRSMGRVDRGDAYLDTDETEKARGITIYSKQAVFRTYPKDENTGEVCERVYTLLDTPGHADFSAEMERTLSVLDAAVLLISAADGVNTQVRALFSMLAQYHVPVLLFVNKMDQAASAGIAEERKDELLSEIRKKLTDAALDVSAGISDPDVQEAAALISEEEELLNTVMNGEAIAGEDLRRLVAQRRLFPVLFGSALKMEGVSELLTLLDICVPVPEPKEDFGARVIKVVRYGAGERETLMRITGGTLRVRDALEYSGRGAASGAGADDDEEENVLREKVTQIRIYSGSRYETEGEAVQGMVCSVCGLTETYAGQGLGSETDAAEGLMTPVLTWQVLIHNGVDVTEAFRRLHLLEEEDPLLRLSYDRRKKEIHASLMGPVQREVLAGQAKKRLKLDISFGRPSVIYKETIAAPVEGVGHFEPLRHYAEVHLLLEPGERGSGIVYDSKCSVDVLPRHFQRLVLSQLAARRHRGVLTGSELTDVKVTLIAGRSHEKHTEGGDFRQAAYRALRQGLMMAENILLEPWYDFDLRLPQAQLGRVLSDLTNMGAVFGAPDIAGEDGAGVISHLAGSAPVAAMNDYREEFAAFTKGEGQLALRAGEYRPCPAAREIVAETGYDPEADTGQPSASVFCSHGAGMLVPWYSVRDYMHIDTGWRPGDTDISVLDRTAFSRAGAAREDLSAGAGGPGAVSAGANGPGAGGSGSGESAGYSGSGGFSGTGGSSGSGSGAYSIRRERPGEKPVDGYAAEAELMAIFERTFGPVKRRTPGDEAKTKHFSEPKEYKYKAKPKAEASYLLVDGYNIVFAWEYLRELASENIDAARDTLLDVLSDYAGYSGYLLICVFDAYKVSGGKERIFRYHNIDVVFTREAETADQYIEKAAHTLQKKYDVTVATSDGIEQMIIFGAGCRRLSASDLLSEIAAAKADAREKAEQVRGARGDRFGETLAEKLDAAVRDKEI